MDRESIVRTRETRAHKRYGSRACFISRPLCNRKVVDRRNDLCNLAQDFASGGASCRAGVLILKVVNIVQGLQATGESELMLRHVLNSSGGRNLRYSERCLCRIERMDALIYFSTKRVELFDMREQLATDLFLIGLREAGNFAQRIVRAFGPSPQSSIFPFERTGRKIWSGRRESNPRMQLGKLPFCH
jgi:hypothetical protein